MILMKMIKLVSRRNRKALTKMMMKTMILRTVFVRLKQLDHSLSSQQPHRTKTWLTTLIKM